MGRREEWKGKPLKGLMQTGQVIAFLVAVILVFSILLDRSPAMFLTGLGASAACLSTPPGGPSVEIWLPAGN